MIERRNHSPYDESNENTSISAAGNESFLSREVEKKKGSARALPADAHRGSIFSINSNLITNMAQIKFITFTNKLKYVFYTICLCYIILFSIVYKISKFKYESYMRSKFITFIIHMMRFNLFDLIIIIKKYNSHLLDNGPRLRNASYVCMSGSNYTVTASGF